MNHFKCLGLLFLSAIVWLLFWNQKLMFILYTEYKQKLLSNGFSTSVCPYFTNKCKSSSSNPSETGTSHINRVYLDSSASPDNSYYQLSCRFPILDPWHPTLRQYIKSSGTFSCPQTQPSLSFLNYSGFIGLNSYKVSLANTTCRYRWFDRDTDRTITFGLWKRLKEVHEKVDSSKDFFEVECKQNKTREQVYFTIHCNPRNLAVKGNPVSEDHLSVLLFVLESTSLSSFRRALPFTHRYITKNMGAATFYGYTKVADNTFPNMIPILTGRRILRQQADMPDEFNETYTPVFDNFSFIWNNFSEKGYLTAYIEDEPQWGLFTSSFVGFRKKPVDFDFRSLFVRMQDLENNGLSSTQHCFRNKPKISYQIDSLQRLLSMYGQTKRLFTYFFHTELSHDEEYPLGKADNILVEFFDKAFSNGDFKQTIVIFMSDHGNRYADIRKTVIGQLEENAPMMHIYLPLWFYTKHPTMLRTLRSNQYRLSSNFDVHETLMDILNGNFNGQQRKLSNRGLSLLYPIPINRTCDAAGIPVKYCNCLLNTTMSISNEQVKLGAAALVKTVNALLRPVSERCHILALKQVVYAYESKIQTNSAENSLRIAVLVEPSEALLESIVSYFDDFKNVTVNKDVSRMNKFKGQSECISNVVLKKFCYCK